MAKTPRAVIKSSRILELPLTQGMTALIDKEDADLACVCWCFSHGYAYRKEGKHTQYLHRLVLARKLGRELVKGEFVDHVNQNRLDCRRENLRLATKAENMQNRGKTKVNTSGYKGVSLRKDTGKYSAQIKVHGKFISLGCYLTLEEAHQAYCDAALKYHGNFACGI